MKKLLSLALLLVSSTAFGAGWIQNEDVKSSADLIAGGGTAAQCINDSKIYVTAKGLNELLSTAITNGDIGGGGSGSVTSVGLTTPSWLTVSGSPVTTSGTLAVTGTSETANFFLAAPNGSSGAMTPRAVVAADIPTLNQNTTGTAANITGTSNSTLTTLSALTSASALTTVGTIGTGTWQGTTVSSTYGGSGVSNPAAHGVLLGEGSSPFNVATPGTSGFVLTSTGTTSDPTWQAATGGFSDPMTTKGDIITYGTGAQRHAVPGDYGALIADSNQTDGWRAASYTTKQGGRPGKNYIQYSDFENDATTGWTLGTVGTLTNGLPTGSPTFGSGASGNLSIAIESSGQLAGSYSLGYVSSAATTAGNMVASSSYALDAEDQAKVITVKFYYEAASGASNMNLSATSSNSYAWAAWDVTNSVWLSSAGNFCMSQSSGVGYCTGTFQTGATTANIRFVLYNANATAGAATLYLDDFYVGPQNAPIGPEVGDWVAYTPTIGGAGTPTNVAAWWKREGDSVRVHGYFTFGTVPGSTLLTVSLPSGESVDSTKTTSTTYSVVGALTGIMGTTATTWPSNSVGVGGPYVMISDAATNSGLVYVARGTSSNAITKMTSDNNFASGNAAEFDFFVPIVGWSSNSVQSSDTDTRAIETIVNANATISVTSGSAIVWQNVVKDVSGSYSSGTYTVPVTGFYEVGVAGTDFTSTTANVRLYKGGSFYATVATLSTGQSQSGKTEGYFNAGDQLTLVSDVTQNITYSAGSVVSQAWFKRLSGPVVITPSVTTAFDYYGSTQTITTTPSALVEPTKLVDTLGAYNTTTGLYPAQMSGTYHCNCRYSATYSAGTTSAAQFYVGGSAVGVAGTSGSATTNSVSIGDDLTVLAGQTVGCYASSGSGSSTAMTASAFSCHRVGY